MRGACMGGGLRCFCRQPPGLPGRGSILISLQLVHPTCQDEERLNLVPPLGRGHEAGDGRQSKRLLGMPRLVDEDVREVASGSAHGPQLRGGRGLSMKKYPVGVNL